jgi:hypothetical protein
VATILNKQTKQYDKFYNFGNDFNYPVLQFTSCNYSHNNWKKIKVMSDNKLNLAGLGQRIINLVVDDNNSYSLDYLTVILLIFLDLIEHTDRNAGNKSSTYSITYCCSDFFGGYYIFTEYKFQMTLGSYY